MPSPLPPPPFPLYLLPTIPFRRRRSSATTVSTVSTSPPSPTSFLSTQPTTHLRCHKCLTDLVPTSSVISKGFTGRYGRAYLVAPPVPSAPLSSLRMFSNPFTHRRSSHVGSNWKSGDLPNTVLGEPQPRQLVTGAHTVSDISCANCTIVLGWKYVEASEESQRYKVGKYILETKRVVKSCGWEDGTGEEIEEIGGVRTSEGEAEVEFDSQDEDECEDLFSGIWSPTLARRSRKKKIGGR